jgi:hypothetical protein
VHHVQALRVYFSVLCSDTCTSSGRRCERVDDDDEMLNTASRYRGTSRYPITQGAHVPKHSTVYNNACSIVRCAHRQEQRSGGDRRLPTRHNGNLKHAQRSCSHVLIQPVAKQCLTLADHGSSGADSPLVRRRLDTQHYALLDSDLVTIACELSTMT